MNEVVLIGRLVRDPEIRYTGTQMAVCTFTLAVDRPFARNRQDGGPTADFIRITVFDRQAENCNRYLAKGSQAAVQGRIQTGSYVNKEGRTVYTTDVIANRVEFIGSRNSNSQGGQGQYSQGGYQDRGSMDQGGYGQNSYQPQPEAVSPAPAVSVPQDDDLPEGFQTIDEDDIPF